jgi:hypothetical protein
VDEFKGLRCWLAVAEPREFVRGAVEANEVRPVVGEIWPAKIFEASGGDDGTQPGGALGLLCGTGFGARGRTFFDLRGGWIAEGYRCDKEQKGDLNPLCRSHESFLRGRCNFSGLGRVSKQFADTDDIILHQDERLMTPLRAGGKFVGEVRAEQSLRIACARVC